MFFDEEPTIDLNKSTILATEQVGAVSIQLSRLPGGDILMDVICEGEVIQISRHRNLTEFQAGRLLEREVREYMKLLR